MGIFWAAGESRVAKMGKWGAEPLWWLKIVPKRGGRAKVSDVLRHNLL